MEKISSYLLAALMLIIVGVLLFTLPLYFLWNWLMPIVFGLPKITLWQSLGLMILSRVLFYNSGDKHA